ncbi:hypothetical protein GS597_00355 [Synechococcales cyanobacterium C]|uniref:Dioxygenase n=1 Tax=Petrachloros mirabilis ULC683 TaxID=2781853 RepID=A0A8K1ZVN5_9CYAN|nr:carotenoid oxygenase family protein [Petrachloros mirabilis]NCJ04996.1 hypothetical protein [Petrachloros mirabilis ULC683]
MQFEVTVDPPKGRNPRLPNWAGAIAHPAVEFGPTPLPVLSGAIPASLRGSLYRNGPGLLERQGQRVAHWFDGDGGILAVHFKDTGATGLYRYVQTQGWQAENQADRFLYAGYGQQASGPMWKRWGTHTKNTANTSVLVLPDRLLALWEGGFPHALDLETLATQGLDDLGSLQEGMTFSAHPKIDPETGEIYNFGVRYGPQPSLQLYGCAPSGQIQHQAKIPLAHAPLIHDFGLAGPYLVFLVPPVHLQLLPVLLGLKGFSDALQWQPQFGTQVIVVERATLTEIARFEVEPWFQWHIGNSYVTESGALIVDLVRYQDFQTNQWLQEVVTGQPQTLAPGTLWRLHLDVKTRQLTHQHPLWHCDCDFPSVAPQEQGQPHQFLYFSTQSSPDAPTEEFFNAIGCLDNCTQAVTSVVFPEGCYPMEPVYVPDPVEPSRGWIATVVYDSQQHQSTVQVFRAHPLEPEAICVLALPEVIPFGFHGRWQAQ